MAMYLFIVLNLALFSKWHYRQSSFILLRRPLEDSCWDQDLLPARLVCAQPHLTLSSCQVSGPASRALFLFLFSSTMLWFCALFIYPSAVC